MRRALRHGPSGGMGELVRVADHEALEGVLRIEDRLPVQEVGGFLLLEDEFDLEGRPPKLRAELFEEGLVAFFEGVKEPRIGDRKHQTIEALLSDLQWSEPGEDLFCAQVLLEALLDGFPDAQTHNQP